jgi:Tfp pilus assembly protein PilX
MKNQKGQILLVVFMMMIFAGILVGGTAFMWQSGVNTSGLEKDSLRAFYIAQASIERGRAEIAVAQSDAYVLSLSGVSFGGGSYNLSISNPNAYTKVITSTGRINNSTQVIRMSVGVPVIHAPIAWATHTKNADTWQEQ